MESAELHFEGNMEDEEWEVWIAKIKTVATEILGFKVGEIEKGEVEIISTFLPKQMNEAETIKICKETIQSIKAQGPKDIGKVMGTIKQKYSDVLDFAKVGALVKEILK